MTNDTLAQFDKMDDELDMASGVEPIAFEWNRYKQEGRNAARRFSESTTAEYEGMDG